MFNKVIILIGILCGAHAGNEAPPPKVHTYNVPSVAKVSYPGPTVTKSVETYSAPSIEKTTTITRTITAPLNAPAGKQIAYSAPSPLIKAHPGPAAVYAGPAPLPAAPLPYAAPIQQFAYAPAPVAYAQQAIAPQPFAYPAPAYAGVANLGQVSAPGLALNSAPLANGAFANQFASLYASPNLGYSLQPQFLAAAGPAYAPPPVYAAGPALAAKGY